MNIEAQPAAQPERQIKRRHLVPHEQPYGVRNEQSPHLPYVLIEKAVEITGYTKRAIQLKIANGVWRQGIEWRKGPDGHRFIDLEAIRKWVEST